MCACLIGRETMKTVPSSILYVLHYSHIKKKNCIQLGWSYFKWTVLSINTFVQEKYILHDGISDNNPNFKSYFDELPHNHNFNFDKNSMQFCYLILWKKEAILNFCLIQDIFVKQVICMITRWEPHWISSKVQIFFLGERDAWRKKK